MGSIHSIFCLLSASSPDQNFDVGAYQGDPDDALLALLEFLPINMYGASMRQQ